MSEALAERCYLYRFFDVEGRLLYVGIARDLGVRFAAHRRRSEWWADVATGTTQTHPSRADAELAEAVAIHSERPLHNAARPTEEKIGRLHAAASQSPNVTRLVAEIEHLRREWGNAVVRLARSEGDIARERSHRRLAESACRRAREESQIWRDAYYRAPARRRAVQSVSELHSDIDWGDL